MYRITGSGGYSNLGARGKNFQKFMLSEKKKRSDLGLDIFLPKSKCSLKKKKKVFTSISPLISLFFFQNEGVLQKKKVFTPNRPLSESKTVYAVFEGGPPKKGGLRRLPHSPHPISTTDYRYKIEVFVN